MKVKKCVGDYVSLQRGLTYKGALVGEPGPALLGLGSIVPGGGFRHDYKTYGGECPSALMLKPGDLFVSLKGATKDGEMIGSVARVPPTVPTGRLTQDTVGLRFHDGDRETVSFLYWVLRTPQYRDYCRGRATGSAVVALSRSDFLSYPVPELTDGRRRLVQLFDAIEDKIELIRKRNRTLEAMAQAIFQSWFVDFDPVKVKAAGRTPPGLPADIAALFPDRFEDSPLGQIPAGWRVGTVGELAEFNGWTLGKRDELDVIDYIEISEVMRGEIAKITRYVRGEEPGRARRRLRHGDTAISTVRPDRGSYFLCIEPSPNLIASTGFAVLTAKSGHWAFVHVLTTGDEFSTELGRLADGGAYPAVRPEVIAARPVVIPVESGLFSAFEKAAQPLLFQAEAGRRESRSLTALRDALLPKLISGELGVPDAERIVGRAT